jgi:hypothetical protein
MSHLWEPLRAEYRPLLFYLGMEGLALCTRQIMASFGFERHELGCLAFYTYKVKPVVSAAPAAANAAAQQQHQREHAAALAALARGGGGGGGLGGLGGSFSSQKKGSKASGDWTPFAAGVPQDINNPLNAAVPLSKDMPIVFCHGVGGLSLYLEMIK